MFLNTLRFSVASNSSAGFIGFYGDVCLRLFGANVHCSFIVSSCNPTKRTLEGLLEDARSKRILSGLPENKIVHKEQTDGFCSSDTTAYQIH